MRSDEDLMLAYVRGDESAVREIFQRYAPVLVRLVQRQIGRHNDAQDIVQQTFLQLHRARRDFRAEMRLRPWIMTIALNLARDLLRRRGRRPESAMEEATLPVSAAVQPVAGNGDADVAKKVRAALSTLPRDQREVI